MVPPSAYGVREVEVDAASARADAASLVADLLRGARGDVARGEVAVSWGTALEEVVALVLRNLSASARPPCFGTQTRPSLRSDSLISVSFDWCGPLTGMQVGWICVKQGLAKPRAALYARQIAVALRAARVRREVVDVAVAAGGQDHGVTGVATRPRRSRDRARRCPARGHRPRRDRASRSRGYIVPAAARSAARAPGTRRGAAAGRSGRARRRCARPARRRRSGYQKAAVLARERDALRDALVDDVDR